MKAKAIVNKLLENDAEAELKRLLPGIRAGSVTLGTGTPMAYTITKVRSSTGEVGIPTGGVRPCGCGGRRIGVRWHDGKLTWVCMKAVRVEGETAVIET